MTFTLENAPSQVGRMAIVTGANAGLGYETTIGLASKGAKVIMACRNLSKAEAAKAEIESKVAGADLDVMQLDLSQLSSVRAFAEDFKREYDSLDLLINNAGIMFPPYEKTEDGFESQMAANYFGHFLLTALLIDVMPDTPESRVVSLSSLAHKSGEIFFDDMHFDKGYDRRKAYGQSKLACLMFADELDRRLKAANKKILSVSAHPGVSDTELARHVPALIAAFFRVTILPFVAHAPDKAALPSLLAAMDPNVQGSDYYGPTGRMEAVGKPGKAKREAHSFDADVGKRLWEVSESLVGQAFSL